MSKNPLVKKTFTAIAIAVFGFILINIAFIFAFFFHSLIDSIASLFTDVNLNTDWKWYPSVKHVLFLITVSAISWYIFMSKLDVFYKAVYMTVPFAVVFATIGILLFQWPIIVFSLSGLLFASILYYFYRTKQPWVYYYSLVLVSLILMFSTIFGVDI